MREIIFRGKRVDNGEWVVGSHIFDALSNAHFICGGWDVVTGSTIANEVIPETVGQYIGRKDKTGVMIYEDDRIATDCREYQVNWNDIFCSFCLDSSDWAHSHWFGESIESNECNVIGNTHDTT